MSMQRKVLRQMAHRQMEIDGIQHPNRPLPGATKDMLNRRDKGQWKDTYFATHWRKYAGRRAAQAALRSDIRGRRHRRAAARV